MQYTDTNGIERAAAAALRTEGHHALVTLTAAQSLFSPGYGVIETATGRMVSNHLYRDDAEQALNAFKEQ